MSVEWVVHRSGGGEGGGEHTSSSKYITYCGMLC